MRGAQATKRPMSREEILRMPVDRVEWKRAIDTVCRQCGDPAYVNPHSNRVLGCANCSFSTDHIDVFFVPRSHSVHRCAD